MPTLFTTTPNLGLKKIADGERNWGPFTRENLDKLDLISAYLLASGKIKIGLTPQSAALVGKANEPVIYGIQGAVTSWYELRFPNSDSAAFWVIPGCVTADFTNDLLKATIRWKTPNVGPVVWQVQMAAIMPGSAMDVVMQPARLFSAVAAAGAEKMVESEITFTPTMQELRAGYPCIISISRLASDPGDTLADVANLVDGSVTLSLPFVQPTFTINTGDIVGEPDASQAVYSYDAEGRVIGVSEMVDSVLKTTTITYYPDADPNYPEGKIHTVAEQYGGTTRTETYTYNPDGTISGMTATVV